MALDFFTAIYLTLGAAFSAICANMVLDRNLPQYANIAAFLILGLLWPVFAAPTIFSAIKRYWFLSLVLVSLIICLCSCAFTSNNYFDCNESKISGAEFAMFNSGVLAAPAPMIIYDSTENVQARSFHYENTLKAPTIYHLSNMTHSDTLVSDINQGHAIGVRWGLGVHQDTVCAQKIHPYCIHCTHYPCICK